MTNLVSIVEDLSALKYEIEDVSTLTDYLGGQINNIEDRNIELNRLHLIDNIIKELGVNPNTKPTKTTICPEISSTRI